MLNMQRDKIRFLYKNIFGKVPLVLEGSCDLMQITNTLFFQDTLKICTDCNSAIVQFIIFF